MEKIPKPELSAAQLARPLRVADLSELMVAIAPTISEFVARATEPLKARIAELESTQLKYCGVWDRFKTFPANAIVTDQGSAWISKTETRGIRPGDDNAFWQLAIKKGKDAR
ncbi:hypothetical protein IVB25_11960 [Bradyrhizobium sp. 193]|uniref:hypothetical protein n=1 Tax=Bradyrhizobium sp. 193 TaxID=2782661 RepID=UPI001FFB3F68|nr:hypothetical protein [Bradyrhizobium sp. 193]MCK1483418.1 hypothetical protein [Bradyrhizobium sp. 193]